MPSPEIDSCDLVGGPPAYVEKLKAREPDIQCALAEMGHHDSTVRWSYLDTGSGNDLFRLLAAEDRNDCIIQVSPLDRTQEHERLDQMLVEGKRACPDVTNENISGEK